MKDGHKVAWVKWDVVCQPKECGEVWELSRFVLQVIIYWQSGNGDFWHVKELDQIISTQIWGYKVWDDNASFYSKSIHLVERFLFAKRAIRCFMLLVHKCFQKEAKECQ